MSFLPKLKKNKPEVVDNSELIPEIPVHPAFQFQRPSVDPTTAIISYNALVRARCSHCNKFQPNAEYWELTHTKWMKGLIALIHRGGLQSLAQQDGPKGEGWKALKKYLEGVKEGNRVIELLWDSCEARKSRQDLFHLITGFFEGTDRVHNKDFLSFVGGLGQPELGVDFDIEDHTTADGLVRFTLKFV